MPAHPTTPSTTAQPAEERSRLLLLGRARYDRHEWNDAFAALKAADELTPLGAADLHRLAWSAGLTARDEEMLTVIERAYHAWLEEGEQLAAARDAFWLGFRLMARGEASGASGWLSRAQRLVELHAQDCVEQGYLLLPAAQRLLNAGEFTKAHDCALEAARIGERFAEADLIAFGRNLQGRAKFSDGHFEAGLALMDEVMVAAAAGELSPVVTGIVYCTAIASCQRVFALDRVREWTAALASWCDAHPQLAIFTGHCLVHRAEVLELSGSWPEAVAEARRAVERCVRDIEREAAGRAHYQQAEIHRLRGEFTLAAAAYREASRAGFEPQPGLALLRLAEGDRDVAAAAIRRMVGATRERLARTRFLPAHVEIMVAVGDLEQARTASLELDETAKAVDSDVLEAIAAHARASIHLAEGNPHAVLDPARSAFRFWQRFGAPYLAARLRVLAARACIALRDAEGARLELQCASEVFEHLGAGPDLAMVKALSDGLGERTGDRAAAPTHGLTERELQVLRLVATGKTNKLIARELSLSEKTVDRHVSNIFAKVNVASRAAATAFAYERGLI
jgi:DNA-binding CsgD family transcriptional regulator/tetratricopeptide (TPR) repeat protein